MNKESIIDSAGIFLIMSQLLCIVGKMTGQAILKSSYVLAMLFCVLLIAGMFLQNIMQRVWMLVSFLGWVFGIPVFFARNWHVQTQKIVLTSAVAVLALGVYYASRINQIKNKQQIVRQNKNHGPAGNNISIELFKKELHDIMQSRERIVKDLNEMNLKGIKVPKEFSEYDNNVLTLYNTVINTYNSEKVKDDWLLTQLQNSVKVLESKYVEFLYKDKYVRQAEEKKTESKENKQEAKLDIFAGCKTKEEIDKRYKALVKPFHPDNKDGDEESVKLINAEYARKKATYC